MLRLATFICLTLLTQLTHATSQSLYQIDMIIFTHQSTPLPNAETTQAPNALNAIPLQSMTSSFTPYHLMPSNMSQLKQEYWALKHKANYQVLAHYSWLQPSNNQNAISIPSTNYNGWNIEGTLRVRQSNYYLVDTQLLFSTPNGKTDTAFLFSQKQRLKPGTVYYLDHAQAGMLIKVHKVA